MRRLVCICAAAMLAAGTLRAEENLIADSTFDKVENGKFTVWTPNKAHEAKISVGKSEDGAQQWIKLTSQDDGNAMCAHPAIEVQPGWKELKLSARLKGTDINRLKPEGWEDARVTVNIKNAEGKYKYYNVAIRENCDWTQLEKVIELEPTAKTIEVGIGMFSTKGTLEVDDLTLEVTKKE